MGKKHDPEFMALLAKHGRLDEKTGNVRFEGMYASVHIDIGWNGTVVSVPHSHVVWFLKHGCWPKDGFQVDHIDDDPMNNAPTNLQELTHGENQEKKRGRTVSRSFGSGKYGHGIYVHKDNRDGRFYVTRSPSRGESKNTSTIKIGLGGFSTLVAAEDRVRECIADIEAGREHKKLQSNRRRPDTSLMRRLRAEGLTLADISKRTGFCEATVWKHTEG